MQIRTLRIGHFGKLHNVTIELADGLNLISGDNESGKSTVHAFITAMLFGIEKTRGRVGKDDLYTRYQPWDTPGAYRGSMDFEHNGIEYRITRVFYMKEKSCVLTQISTGRRVELAGDTITSLIPELTLSAWTNTVSMGQKALRFSEDFVDDMQNYIANLSMTGSGRVDVADALDSLDGKRKSVRKEYKGKSAKEIAERLDELTRQEKQAGGYENDRRRLRALEREEAEAAGVLKSNLPDIGTIRDELKARRADVEEQINLMQTSPENDGSSGKMLRCRKLGIAATVAGLAGALLCGGKSAVGIGLSVIAMIAGLICIFVATVRIREKNRDAGADESFDDYRRATDAYDEVLKRFEKAEQEQKEAEELIKKHEELADGYGRAAEKAEWQLEMMGDIGIEIEECEQELADAQRAAAEAERDLSALDLAYTTIGQLAEDIRDDFAAEFNDLLSEEVSLATDGKYQRARIGDSMSVEVMGELDFVKAEALSAGTLEQLYMAFRFAAARLMLGDVPVPMLLDESFAYCDESRLTAALSALADRDNQQIVLFSCRTTERDILRRLGSKVNIIQM